MRDEVDFFCYMLYLVQMTSFVSGNLFCSGSLWFLLAKHSCGR